MRLRELRESKGIFQKHIAEAIYTSKNTISNWEKGVSEPNIEFLIKLADFFQCTVDYLIGRENDMGIINANANLTNYQNELLEKAAKLSVADQNKVLGYIQALMK